MIPELSAASHSQVFRNDSLLKLSCFLCENNRRVHFHAVMSAVAAPGTKNMISQECLGESFLKFGVNVLLDSRII